MDKFDHLIKCQVCYCPIINKIIPHHIEYFPELIIIVCESCHSIIHFTWEYPHLRPRRGEADKFYRLDKIQTELTIKENDPLTQAWLQIGQK